MATYTVYLDQAFFGNMVMNYAILWAAAKLSRTAACKWRLVAGAALGACYALTLFIPGDQFLFSIWFKTIASVVITAVAFVPLPSGKFLACLGCFYLTSFTLGGLIFGMIFFIQSGRLAGYNGVGVVVAEYFWPGLFWGLAAFWAAGRGVAALLKKGSWENLFKMDLVVKWNGAQVRTGAILDSGNHLKDPMTQNPVVVMEYPALKSLLPAQVQVHFERVGEPDVWGILSSLAESGIAPRFSAVPFQSLGRANGLLLGFRPDEAVVERTGRQTRLDKVVIAIYHKKLDPAGSYQALLGHGLMERL